MNPKEGTVIASNHCPGRPRRQRPVVRQNARLGEALKEAARSWSEFGHPHYKLHPHSILQPSYLDQIAQMDQEFSNLRTQFLAHKNAYGEETHLEPVEVEPLSKYGRKLVKRKRALSEFKARPLESQMPKRLPPGISQTSYFQALRTREQRCLIDDNVSQAMFGLPLWSQGNGQQQLIAEQQAQQFATDQQFTIEQQEQHFTANQQYTTKQEFATNQQFTVEQQYITEPQFTTEQQYTPELQFTTEQQYTPEPQSTPEPKSTPEPQFTVNQQNTRHVQYTTDPQPTINQQFVTEQQFTTGQHQQHLLGDPTMQQLTQLAIIEQNHEEYLENTFEESSTTSAPFWKANERYPSTFEINDYSQTALDIMAPMYDPPFGHTSGVAARWPTTQPIRGQHPLYTNSSIPFQQVFPQSLLLSQGSAYSAHPGLQPDQIISNTLTSQTTQQQSLAGLYILARSFIEQNVSWYRARMYFDQKRLTEDQVIKFLNHPAFANWNPTQKQNEYKLELSQMAKSMAQKNVSFAMLLMHRQKCKHPNFWYKDLLNAAKAYGWDPASKWNEYLQGLQKTAREVVQNKLSWDGLIAHIQHNAYSNVQFQELLKVLRNSGWDCRQKQAESQQVHAQALNAGLQPQEPFHPTRDPAASIAISSPNSPITSVESAQALKTTSESRGQGAPIYGSPMITLSQSLSNMSDSPNGSSSLYQSRNPSPKKTGSPKKTSLLKKSKPRKMKPSDDVIPGSHVLDIPQISSTSTSVAERLSAALISTNKQREEWEQAFKRIAPEFKPLSNGQMQRLIWGLGLDETKPDHGLLVIAQSLVNLMELDKSNIDFSQLKAALALIFAQTSNPMNVVTSQVLAAAEQVQQERKGRQSQNNTRVFKSTQAATQAHTDFRAPTAPMYPPTNTRPKRPSEAEMTLDTKAKKQKQ
jgi:hypothetical protein